MATNGETETRSLSELLLAGLGWASLNLESVDEFADDLARRVGVDRGDDAPGGPRHVRVVAARGERVGVRRDEAVERALAKVGLVRRDELEDLELRVAQLEHRLRLLEGCAGVRPSRSGCLPRLRENHL